MPKIICKVCNGTKDANYDLPSDEYVHYPCTACKEGIENYCGACNGRGEYWIYGGFGDNAYLHWCSSCKGNGWKLDSVKVEEECICVTKGPELRKKQEEEFGWLKDFFEESILNNDCLHCRETKKVITTYYEGSKEYEKEKAKIYKTAEKRN